MRNTLALGSLNSISLGFIMLSCSACAPSPATTLTTPLDWVSSVATHGSDVYVNGSLGSQAVVYRLDANGTWSDEGISVGGALWNTSSGTICAVGRDESRCIRDGVWVSEEATDFPLLGPSVGTLTTTLILDPTGAAPMAWRTETTCPDGAVGRVCLRESGDMYLYFLDESRTEATAGQVLRNVPGMDAAIDHRGRVWLVADGHLLRVDQP